MNYKTQSLITIGVVLVIMVSVGIFIGSMDSKVTGAVTKECECSSDFDCNDNNPCTEDICLYPETCNAAKCINKIKENCVK